MSQCASWKQDRSVPKLWGLSISHICVAQPASALSVCQAENQALWNPSCSQLCCPGTQVWTKFRLEKMRNCSEPSAGVIHGKTQVPSLQLSLVITLLEQQELQPGKNLLYYQNHSSAQTEIAAVGQNIILTTWSRTFVYFCSSISSISSAANNQPMGLTS